MVPSSSFHMFRSEFINWSWEIIFWMVGQNSTGPSGSPCCTPSLERIRYAHRNKHLSGICSTDLRILIFQGLFALPREIVYLLLIPLNAFFTCLHVLPTAIGLIPPQIVSKAVNIVPYRYGQTETGTCPCPLRKLLLSEVYLMPFHFWYSTSLSKFVGEDCRNHLQCRSWKT